MSITLQDVKNEVGHRKISVPRVDYHCHISMTEYADIENPTVVSVIKEEFIADLDEGGIDKAVVLSDMRTTPEQVSAFVRRAPDRFISFGYVNPLRRGASEDVLRQRHELGLFGLKLYPTTDGYLADDPKAFRVYEAAASVDMPVMLHLAGMPVPTDLMKHADPFHRQRSLLLPKPPHSSRPPGLPPCR